MSKRFINSRRVRAAYMVQFAWCMVHGTICLGTSQVVGLQPTVIASRASPPLLEQSSSKIQRIVDARRPSTSQALLLRKVAVEGKLETRSRAALLCLTSHCQTLHSNRGRVRAVYKAKRPPEVHIHLTRCLRTLRARLHSSSAN